MLLVSLVTIAPGGVAVALGFGAFFNEHAIVCMIAFWLLFSSLWVGRFTLPSPKARSVVFVFAGTLVLLNLGGCASIWTALSGIN